MYTNFVFTEGFHILVYSFTKRVYLQKRGRGFSEKCFHIFFKNNKNTSNRSFTLIKMTIYLRLRSDIFLTGRGYSYLVTPIKIISCILLGRRVGLGITVKDSF